MDHLGTGSDRIRGVGVQHDHERRLGHLHLVVGGHREPRLEIRISHRDEAPRLQVEGRRRQRRRADDVLDVLPGHRLRREAAHRPSPKRGFGDREGRRGAGHHDAMPSASPLGKAGSDTGWRRAALASRYG